MRERDAGAHVNFDLFTPTARRASLALHVAGGSFFRSILILLVYFSRTTYTIHFPGSRVAGASFFQSDRFELFGRLFFFFLFFYVQNTEYFVLLLSSAGGEMRAHILYWISKLYECAHSLIKVHFLHCRSRRVERPVPFHV